LNVLGKQATNLGEAYTRAVKMQEKPNPECPSGEFLNHVNQL
jgi:hypothetical protein